VSYSPWVLRRDGDTQSYEITDGRTQGKAIVARFAGIDDRTAAASLVGAEILVAREQFSRAEEHEFFWADLVGLRVETEDGQLLGNVDHLLETGANDVLVVEGQRRVLVPFVMNEVVKRVDIGGGLIVVDWDPGW
jgi:16S rRNA processing protein RimM